MLVFPPLSPEAAQVHIAVENSLMLGYKGHKCFLSPLRLGVRLTYTGGGKKSLQQKKLFLEGDLQISQSLLRGVYSLLCPALAELISSSGEELVLLLHSTLSPLLCVGDLRAPAVCCIQLCNNTLVCSPPIKCSRCEYQVVTEYFNLCFKNIFQNVF